MANTITAQEFAQIMRDAIAQIQPAAAAAPVVNVEAPAAPAVEVDVEGIIAQLRAMRGTMVRPSNLRGIVQQVKELQTVSKQNTRQIVAAIETLANTTPEQTDIQPIVDELLEITGGIELLGEDVRAATQEVANVADIMNPYRNMTREQIVQEFQRMGFDTYKSFTNDTRDVLSRKLNFIKLMEEQSDALEAYRSRAPAYIPANFTRSSFDTFVSVSARGPKGTPLSEKYAYIPKSIPHATVVFNKQKGMYEMRQGDSVDFALKYYDAQRWALSGGAYSDEMKALRKIRQNVESRKSEIQAMYKARKW